MTEALVSEGLVTVRRENVRQTPELARLMELEDAAKAAGKGKWGSSPSSVSICQCCKLYLINQNTITKIVSEIKHSTALMIVNLFCN